MNGKFALIVHRDVEILKRTSEALVAVGCKVMADTSDEEALQRLGTFFVPDVLLTSLDAEHPEGSQILSQLRSNPLTRHVPMIVLASGDPDERRRCLRLGMTHLVPPPHDPEEIVLTTRLALEQHRDENLLTGSLEQLSVTDLLQTVETTRRSGIITFRSEGRSGRLWLRGGRVVDAELEDGRRGQEAVFAIAFWERGAFEADFRSISVPERISESTSYLLLEAMRRRDEAARAEDSPPNAALPDPPPLPPRPVLAIHRALTLLNVTASYAENHLEPKLLDERLERHREALVVEHPILRRFTVGSGGRTTWNAETIEEVEVEVLVEGVARWLHAFFNDMERALPRRFAIKKLRNLTEAVHEDMQDLGFYEALGLLPTVREEAP